ncbi:unnamed protein product [Closterium sp. Naga37s-1]|nr:unnamed protein product [Closterium sp. Naga37s-1]
MDSQATQYRHRGEGEQGRQQEVLGEAFETSQRFVNPPFFCLPLPPPFTSPQCPSSSQAIQYRHRGEGQQGRATGDYGNVSILCFPLTPPFPHPPSPPCPSPQCPSSSQAILYPGRGGEQQGRATGDYGNVSILLTIIEPGYPVPGQGGRAEESEVGEGDEGGCALMAILYLYRGGGQQGECKQGGGWCPSLSQAILYLHMGGRAAGATAGVPIIEPGDPVPAEGGRAAGEGDEGAWARDQGRMQEVFGAIREHRIDTVGRGQVPPRSFPFPSLHSLHLTRKRISQHPISSPFPIGGTAVSVVQNHSFPFPSLHSLHLTRKRISQHPVSSPFPIGGTAVSVVQNHSFPFPSLHSLHLTRKRISQHPVSSPFPIGGTAVSVVQNHSFPISGAESLVPVPFPPLAAPDLQGHLAASHPPFLHVLVVLAPVAGATSYNHLYRFLDARAAASIPLPRSPPSNYPPADQGGCPRRQVPIRANHSGSAQGIALSPFPHTPSLNTPLRLTPLLQTRGDRQGDKSPSGRINLLQLKELLALPSLTLLPAHFFSHTPSLNTPLRPTPLLQTRGVLKATSPHQGESLCSS